VITFSAAEELRAWAASPCVAVFGSYRAREGSDEYLQAAELGARLAARGYTICSGGYEGTMEAVLRGAASQGGKCVGILTRYFDFTGLRANQWVQACVVMQGLIDRIEAFNAVADAFVVLPGSTGTLAELTVTLEVINKSTSPPRPLVCLGDYWRPVIEVVGKEPRPFHPDQFVASLVHLASGVDEVVRYLDGSIGGEKGSTR
jgi:uncharacterized protein (TIGR00730 family)